MTARGGGSCGGGYGSNGENGKLKMDAGRRKRSLRFDSVSDTDQC
jgi:hypothetical protein